MRHASVPPLPKSCPTRRPIADVGGLRAARAVVEPLECRLLLHAGHPHDGHLHDGHLHDAAPRAAATGATSQQLAPVRLNHARPAKIGAQAASPVAPGGSAGTGKPGAATALLALVEAAPKVTGVTFNGGQAQRSMVRSIAVTFDRDVAASLQPSDLLLWNHTTSAFIDTAASRVTWASATLTATWTFPAGSFVGGSVPDGNYRATLPGMQVLTPAGAPLDGDADGVGGDDYVFSFYRLFGDLANGASDRDVDSSDSIGFRAALNAVALTPGYNAGFDYDADGDVDTSDSIQFRVRLNRVLSPFAGNASPAGPPITEPLEDGKVVSGQDVHMEAFAFADPDAADANAATDWEIWTVGPNPVRVWSAIGKTTFEDRVHIHFAQGVFEGPQAGKGRLEQDRDYRLRARKYDDRNDPGTSAGAWSVRTFHTLRDDPPSAIDWTVDQPGYKIEEVPFSFAAGERFQNFRMPTGLAFKPNPGSHPDDVLFYVAGLYGTIWSVTRNFTVRTYADGLLNYNPTGNFSGDGEGGVTSIAVDPQSGDVFAAMLYDINPSNTTLSGETFPKVTRFTSANGGLSSTDAVPATPGVTDGTDILRVQNTADSNESQLQSHIISDISFGPDGKVYVHSGDGFDSARAMRLNSFGGKIWRLNPDGTAPADNPFNNAANGGGPADRLADGKPDAVDYVWARGFRNPFGGVWNQAQGQHYEVENGGGANDRFAKVRGGVAYNYNGNDATLATNAIYNWNPTVAPVDVAFVEPGVFGGSGFPAAKQGHAFVTISGATYASGPDRKRLAELVVNPDANGNGNPGDDNGVLVGTPASLARYTGAGKSTLAGLAAGPEGLYFSTLYNDAATGGPTARGGKVLRVVYTGIADFTATPTSAAAAPLTVAFTNASDVPGQTAWLWDFGDGTTGTDQNPTHVYAQPGSYGVTLTVTGANGTATVAKPNLIAVGQAGGGGGNGSGLVGEYFNNVDFTAEVLTRVDPAVDYNYGPGSPDPLIGADTFSARWTGKVEPRFSEAYTFLTTSDDGVRLTVNGQVLVDNLTDHSATTDSGTINLVAGVKYDVRLEYYEQGGDGTIRLEWQSGSQARQVVPQSQLYAAGTAGLLARYGFETATGTATPDASGNNHNATLAGGPVLAAGIAGQGLSLDGVNDHATVASRTALNPTAGLTISAWVKADTWANGNHRIVQKGATDNQYRLLAENDLLQFQLAGVTNGDVAALLPSAGIWHQVVGAYDGATIRLYVDGVQVAFRSASGAIATTNNTLFLGTKAANAPVGDFFDGTLDEIRLYNRSLAPAEVLDLFRSQS